MKKWLVIGGGLFLLFLILGAVFGDDAPQNQSGGNAAPQPRIIRYQLSTVIGSTVLSPRYSDDGGLIWYYSAADTSLKRLDVVSGTETVLQKIGIFPNEVVWSPRNSQAVFAHQEVGRQAAWYLASFNSGSVTPLKEGLENPTWTSGGDRLFYKFYSPGDKERSLNVSDPDGSNWRKLIDISLRSISTAPLEGNLVAAWPAPSSRMEGGYYTIDTATGASQKVLGGGYGADYLPHLKSKKIFISRLRQAGGDMVSAVANADGSGYRELSLATFAAKTAWSQDGATLYMAVPKFIPVNSRLPEDFLSGSLATQDAFWAVDINTGATTLLYDPSTENRTINADRLFVDSQGRLYFVNRYSGHLHRLDPVMETPEE